MAVAADITEAALTFDQKIWAGMLERRRTIHSAVNHRAYSKQPAQKTFAPGMVLRRQLYTDRAKRRMMVRLYNHASSGTQDSLPVYILYLGQFVTRCVIRLPASLLEPNESHNTGPKNENFLIWRHWQGLLGNGNFGLCHGCCKL